MSGLWTKKDQEWWDNLENQFIYNFNLLFTSGDYWERTKENVAKRERALRKLYQETINIYKQKQELKMTAERIKQIQSTTGHPDSVSVQQALMQVWNEVAQEYRGTKFYVYVTEFCKEGSPYPNDEREAIHEIKLSNSLPAESIFNAVEQQIKSTYDEEIKTNPVIVGFKLNKILLALDKYLG